MGRHGALYMWSQVHSSQEEGSEVGQVVRRHYTQESQAGLCPNSPGKFGRVGREGKAHSTCRHQGALVHGRSKGAGKDEEGGRMHGQGWGSHTHIDAIPGEVGPGLL